MKALIGLTFALGLAGCGVAYFSPGVTSARGSDAKVRVEALTSETVLVANQSDYRPKGLPAVFFANAGGGSVQRGAGLLPEPPSVTDAPPRTLETRLPPAVTPGPYRIGVGDVLLLATPSAGDTVEELTGLLAATNARQGYTVQDDGTIAIPNVGRVDVGDLTLEEAEVVLFQRLVENQINPTFSLEVTEFNSKRVSIGGAVRQPGVAPITLMPLYLDEALAQAGGITAVDQDFTSIRIYRDGTLYQIPLTELFSNSGLQRIQLQDGDSVFVDTEYELGQAERYFNQQIQLANLRQDARVSALNELRAEVEIRRGALDEERRNFQTRLDLDAVERDYVYLTGEVAEQGRFTLPFGRQASLADALYSTGGIVTETGNVREIYVLRASPDPRDFGAVTAWQLDARDAANLLVATRFELRPNDVIFVAEQPVTRWGRVIQQITPSLITATVASATR